MRKITLKSIIYPNRYYLVIVPSNGWYYLYGFATKRFLCRDLDPVKKGKPFNTYYIKFSDMKMDIKYELSDNADVICYEFNTKKEALEYRKRRKVLDKLCL